MSRPASFLVRWFEPLAAVLWIGFVLGTGLAAVIWTAGLGEHEAAAWVQRHFPAPEAGTVGYRSPLGTVLAQLLALLDPAWLVLAFANCYASLVAAEGLASARRWTSVVLAGALVLAACSVHSGWPLGPISYSSRLGPGLAGVPLGVLLLSAIVIFGARQAVRRLWPGASHGLMALGAGLLSLLTIWNLEPVAWHRRVWWLREAGGLPWLWYAGWLAAGAGCAWLFRSRGARSQGEESRAALTLLLLNLLCLLARLGALLQK